jgi:ACR3 family arsenite efflux pump ArsB
MRPEISNVAPTWVMLAGALMVTVAPLTDMTLVFCGNSPCAA